MLITYLVVVASGRLFTSSPCYFNFVMEKMLGLQELIKVFFHIITTKDAKINDLTYQIECMQHSLSYYQEKWCRDNIKSEKNSMLYNGDTESLKSGYDEVDR